ncbi:MAG: DUF4383 domain-containing protein [Chloroflexota bacterium]
MAVRYFSLIFGIVYILIGLMGFIPAILAAPQADTPNVTVNTLYGFLFGIFAVNLIHSLVHLLAGIWGVIAYRSFDASRTFAKASSILFGLLAVMGLIPGLNTFFGLIPLFGHDIWLHALSAVIAGYFGFVYRPTQPVVQ